MHILPYCKDYYDVHIVERSVPAGERWLIGVALYWPYTSVTESFKLKNWIITYFREQNIMPTNYKLKHFNVIVVLLCLYSSCNVMLVQEVLGVTTMKNA